MGRLEKELNQKKEVYTDWYQRFWGTTPRDEKGLKKRKCEFDEEQFYKALCDIKKGDEKLFNVTPFEKQRAVVKILSGRPNWEEFFRDTNNSTPYEDVGVCFCGNPFIGKALEENCSRFTKQNKRSNKKLTWRLH